MILGSKIFGIVVKYRRGIVRIVENSYRFSKSVVVGLEIGLGRYGCMVEMYIEGIMVDELLEVRLCVFEFIYSVIYETI